MSLIDRAEQLKKELTDKWVVVSSTTPELKRFASLTGRVKTVNMNCRALVEFDNGIDISWYDIEPGYLTVVDGPRPKKAAAPAAQAKQAPKPAVAPAASSTPAAATGSPLDKIRAAAAKPAAAAPAAGGSPMDKIRAAAAGGSPMDKIRAAQAKPVAAAAPPAEAAAPAVAAPAPAPAPAAKAPAPAPAAGGSPLDRIRAQGAAKKDG